MDPTDLSETLSAFLDGEPVDPGELALALVEPEGRAFLVDVARVRRALAAGDDLPAAAAVNRIRQVLEPSPRRGWFWIPVPAPVLALLVLLVVGLGLVDGWRREGPPDPLPVPDRVLPFEEGRDWGMPGGTR